MAIIDHFDVETSDGRRFKILCYAPFENDLQHTQMITECGNLAEEVVKGLYSIFLPDGVVKLATKIERPPARFSNKNDKDE